MNFALVGTGQTGQAVEDLALERGHTIAARFNRSSPLPDDVSALRGADVVIEFSTPDAVLPHLERYCRWNQAAVIGTTGWLDHLDRVREWVAGSEAAVLYAPNFSLGVAVLVQAIRAVAPLLDALPEYDAFVHEAHHRRKLDSPSGTALMLADELLARLSAKTHIETETQHGRIAPDALHVSSTRAGDIIGRHSVGFDSAFDAITLTHDAKNRTGFAFGAVRAAEWLPGRKGLFTLDDVLAHWPDEGDKRGRTDEP